MNEEKPTRTLSEEMRNHAVSPDPLPRHISHLQWMSVPKAIRIQLAGDLKLRPSTHTEIASTPSGGIREVSDGFTEKDLLNITPELLQDYTNSKEDELDALWTLALRKADILVTSVEVPLASLRIEPYVEPKPQKEVLVRLNKPENVIPKVVAQPKKNAKKTK